MLNKIKMFVLCIMTIGVFMPVSSFASTEEIVDIEEVSADAVENYQVEGSLFQQITDLEQEKVLMQLEKERAQLDLDLDRLAAEKIKLHMEIDTLSGRAEAQQQELETQMARLEAEAARLAREKESLENPTTPIQNTSTTSVKSSTTSLPKSFVEEPESTIGERFKLINVIGAGTQLQATVVDLTTGQNKRISVGKVLDGWTVKSISLDDGVVFSKDGQTQTLNISNAN